jgi:hypothetical protein
MASNSDVALQILSFLYCISASLSVINSSFFLAADSMLVAFNIISIANARSDFGAHTIAATSLASFLFSNLAIVSLARLLFKESLNFPYALFSLSDLLTCADCDFMIRSLSLNFTLDDRRKFADDSINALHLSSNAANVAALEILGFASAPALTTRTLIGLPSLNLVH